MTASTGHPMAIDLKNVTKVYRSGGGLLGRSSQKVIALNNVDLNIGSGEIFGLVGESGSGKTTIGRLIVRLEKPTHGDIKVNDVAIAHLRGSALKNFRRRVQMIFQDPYQSLNPYLCVIDTVAEPLTIHKKGASNAIRETVIHTLETVGLTPAKDFLMRYPHQLSGGQRQRVAIARAMVLEPDMVVADEPTSMLDASISVQIFQILANIQRRKRMTLLFITHSLAAAHYLCDRIAVIYRGHIVETGPAETIISAPCHPYTQALMDALPKFGHLWNEKRFDALRIHERSVAHSDGCPFFSRCNRAQETRCADNRPEMMTLDKHHHSACFFADQLKNGGGQ
ncbi:MAG: ATP-binding cassette domain-containing protein [Desulfobacterales bacterium]|nr:ATP-binding cassette domain-containing protein [Desulfobacterales bacterium]